MKKYSTFVYDKMTGNAMIIRNQEYENKKDFIYDLRKNGWRVNPKKVKESALFEYIINETNCNPWDWDLKAIPESEYL